MYTVFKIIEEIDNNILESIVAEINKLVSIKFSKMHKINGYACDIYKGLNWDENCAHIKLLLKKIEIVFRMFSDKSIVYHIDIAIDEKDTRHKVLTTFLCDLDLIRMLNNNNISLEFSLYCL